MKNVFSKSDFPKAPGGDRYEWENAETGFKIPKTGLYVIAVAAKAKDAKQNRSTDDDDLRIALDGFNFGKYEKRKDEISWKGFGTSASFDGASSKGGKKTIYYFVELDQGEHLVQFFADGRPEILSFEVFEVKDLHFELKNLMPNENIDSSSKGIPWLSFVFLGTNAKSIFFDVDTKSAKEKGSTDGDNLKIVVNGKILKNPVTPNPKKYQNFYFSGDIKSIGLLSLSNNEIADPLAFENAVEIWYDLEPKLNNLRIEFFDVEGFMEEYKDFDFAQKVRTIAWLAIGIFKVTFRPYSAKLLKHSLNSNPPPLLYKANHPIVEKIKNDPAYKKIIEKLVKKLSNGQLAGEIWPKEKINFDSWDLATAIHGIKKIEYDALIRKNGQFAVKLKLFDVYDFQSGDVPYFLFHLFTYLNQGAVNTLDFGEELGVINNFEIQININQFLWI
ncbi:hypothetical protein HY604_01465 [Candidatus Peregrinibacteria bacterium]|nr:hypothetical protein [Candidatus Peregrinibacteria bacterium]